MDLALQTILELSRDPMLALADGKILLMNAPARERFPELRPGDAAENFLPAAVPDAGGSSESAAVLRGEVYSVSRRCAGGVILLALRPEPSAASLRGCLSDGQMSAMLSALFNIALAADRLMARMAPEDAEARHYYGMLCHNYYSLSRRLGNLNALCTLSEDGMGLTLRHADLVCVCEQLVFALSSLLGTEGARVEFITELETLPACVDVPKLERLLLNLISNSLLHTPPAGFVRLRLSKSGANALLSVDDNGSGIPPEKLRSVFHSFTERMDPGTLAGENGGGLGLALCSLIAEKHGGTVVLESREDRGTSVRVLLPLCPPGAEVLGSEPPMYVCGGIHTLLTELSELLDSESYVHGFPD